MPPFITVGSSLAASSSVATREVVVVLPCVPATATDQRSRMSSPSISALWTTGKNRFLASITSTLSGLIAVEMTTMAAVSTFAAACGVITFTPLARSRFTLVFSDKSLPCT